MNTTITSQSAASSVASQANGRKSFSPSTNPDKFGRKVTIETALQAIQRKFSDLADILSIEDEGIIDIILKDLYTNNFYEVYSNREHTKLQIRQLNLLTI